MKKVLFTLVLAVSFLGCKSDSIDECDCSQYIELNKESSKGSFDINNVPKALKFPFDICHDGATFTIKNKVDVLEHVRLHIEELKLGVVIVDTLGECQTLGVEDLEYDECFNWCQENK